MFRRLLASRLLLATIVGCTLMLCPMLSAAAPTAKNISSVESIRGLMEKGQSLFVAGECTKAAQVFEAGYELHPYSAFLFNAAVALEKCDRPKEAVERFKRYLEVDPQAPDADAVQARIQQLEQKISAGQTESGKPPGSPSPGAGDSSLATKSLVVVDTDPAGAPLRIYQRQSGELPFELQQSNPGWHEVMTARSPANLSLDVGTYFIEVEPFGDYNRGGAEVEVEAGRVVKVQVNPSQGAFQALLRVETNANNARIYVDDLRRRYAPWGKAPHAELVKSGEHTILIAAPGYESARRKVTLEHGRQRNLRVNLERVHYGTLSVQSNASEVAVSVDEQPPRAWRKKDPPLEIAHLSSGRHRIRVTADGRKALETDVEVPRGQTLPVKAFMVVTPPRGAAWTQGIIAGALLGAGVYLGLESNRSYDELTQARRRGTLERDDPRVLKGKILAVGADVTFFGAAIMGGLSTYNFLKDPLPPSRLEVGTPVDFDEDPEARNR